MAFFAYVWSLQLQHGLRGGDVIPELPSVKHFHRESVLVFLRAVG